MSLPTPLKTILHLLAARSRGDLAAALTCYEPNATVVMAPGKYLRGESAVKAFTKATIALPITFGEPEIIEADGIALHLSRWTVRQVDSSEISARTTDVLRRQPDGNWLLAIDNPWGSSLLERKHGAINPLPTNPGDNWIKITTETDLQVFASAFTADVSLETSVASSPIIGPANLRRYFDASRAIYQRIAVTHETTAGGRTCLEWEGEYKGRYIAGATILVQNLNGAIESIQLYHRPYEQVVAFSAELAQSFEALHR